MTNTQVTKEELLELADLIEAGVKLAPKKHTGAFFAYQYDPNKDGYELVPGRACAMGCALLAKGFKPLRFAPSEGEAIFTADPTGDVYRIIIPALDGWMIDGLPLYNWIYRRNDGYLGKWAADKEAGIDNRLDIARELREVAGRL